MNLWTQNITPRSEIVNEPINESTFAARLDEVVSGRAAPYYRDPVLFFDNTHITKGMEKLLNIASQTFSTNKCPGNNVIELQTSFGGGKTHCLVALYHLSQRPNLLNEHPNLSSLKIKAVDSNLKVKCCVLVGLDYNISEPRSVSIDGKQVPLNTWWGEIAYQLGGEKAYKKIQSNDKDWIPPSKSSLNEVFKTIDNPCLILLDEIVHYLINVHKKNPEYYGLMINFFQVLVEEVSNHPNVILVFTLPASDLELVNKLGRQAFHTIDKHTKRHKTTIDPVQYEEVYHIIRCRLFEPVNQSQDDGIKRVCNDYLNYYMSKKKFFPEKVTKKDITKRALSFNEKMNIGYPFHPALIDVLYQKWGPHPDFQRTRGILRVFAKILNAIYRNIKSDIITIGDVPLKDASVKGELLGYLGTNFEPVLTTDLGRATDLEESLGDDYLTFHLGQAIFTGFFFHSMKSTTTNIGATREELCLAILKPSIKYPALVIDMLEEMKNHLFHLFEMGDRYYLLTRANPVSMILAEKENLSQDTIKIEAFIEKLMDKAIPKAHGVIIWPDDSKNIPDQSSITLIAMNPDYLVPKGFSSLPNVFASKIEDWITNRGTIPRENKNGLVFIFFEETEYISLRDNVLELMAIENVIQQAKNSSILEKAQINDLMIKKKNLETSIPKLIISSYSYIGRPTLTNTDGISKVTLSLYTIDNSKSIFVQRVKEEMKTRDWLLGQIGRKIIPSNFSDYTTTQELWQRQFNVPGLELYNEKNVLLSAIRSVISTTKEGQDKYGYGNLKKDQNFNTNLEPDDFTFIAKPGTQVQMRDLKVSETSYLISESFLKTIESNVSPPEPPIEEPPIDEPPIEETPIDGPPIDEPPIDEPPGLSDTETNIKLNLDVSWDRINDLRKFVTLCNFLGQKDPNTIGKFTLEFKSESAFSKLVLKNLKKALDDLKVLWGDDITIEFE